MVRIEKMKNKNIGWQRVLLIIFPYLIIGGVFQFIGMLIAGVGLHDLNAPKTSEQELIMNAFTLLGTALVIWIFVRFVEKGRMIDVGFQFKNRLPDMGWGLAIGALIMGLGYLLLLALGEIDFQQIDFNLLEIINVTVLFAFVALTEELLMRGYVLRNLMVSFNKYLALILSAALFSLMHIFNSNTDLFSFINLFTAGLLLGAAYIHTRNLWFPLALHFSWNLFQSLMGFNVSGQDIYSLIQFRMVESNHINGGDFGFEGSYFSLVAEIVVLVGIEVYYQKKKNQPGVPILEE